MIKIKKFENVFGIKKLNNCSLIEGNTIIYSPNGVMKSSLTDGLTLISKNENPRDLFNNINSSYEIANHRGSLITETVSPKELNLISFKGEDISEKIFNDANIARLVVSPELKTEYETKFSSLVAKIETIKEIISKYVLEEKTYSAKSKVDVFLSNYEGRNDIERIYNMLETKHEEIAEDVSSLSFTIIFNDKTLPIFNDPRFIEKTQKYQDLKDSQLNEIIFANGFGLEELKKINDAAKKNHFYEAGHKLFMDGAALNETEVDSLINDTIISVYGTVEMQNAFLEAKLFLEKNADSRKIVEVIQKNEWILEKLSKPNEFKESLIFAKIKDYVEQIKEIKKQIDTTKKEIDEIFKVSNTKESIWKEVLNTYNSRFMNRHFDINIQNEENAVLGIENPVFVKVMKKGGASITPAVFQRFSSGEKRAIFILYFLFEIEAQKLSGEEFTIVFDDIVDSFDYKNKYAMIEYLSELSENEKIQLIILTHNFDFYRSCRYKFGNKLTSQLMAYLDAKDEVELFNASSGDYESFALITRWKKNDDITSLIALIPFLRNMVELKDGKTASHYELLCDYLHFNLNTGNRKLSDIINVYSEYNIKCEIIDDSPYWDALKKEVESISPQLPESDLQKKVILGLFIRLASDYLLLTRYRENTGNYDPQIPPGSNWSNKLKIKTIEFLPQTEKELVNRASTVAPSFVHVNGFMYEPLIDVGSEKILSIAQEFLDKIKEIDKSDN